MEFDGFTCYETQGVMIVSYDLLGHTMEEAEELVKKGDYHWVLGPCCTLTLAPAVPENAPTQGGT